LGKLLVRTVTKLLKATLQSLAHALCNHRSEGEAGTLPLLSESEVRGWGQRMGWELRAAKSGRRAPPVKGLVAGRYWTGSMK